MSPRLARILLAAFCVTAVAQQTNLGSLIFGDECRDDCPDGDASHRCPLNCTSCACVGHGTPVSLASATAAARRPVVAHASNDEPRRLPDPPPTTIFHVPRPVLL
jgi:hypothetical protein